MALSSETMTGQLAPEQVGTRQLDYLLKWRVIRQVDMRVIAIEEAFSYPPSRRAAPDNLALQGKHPLLKDVLAKLEDLGPRRLADMDSAGIDMQVISHTTPGPEALKGTHVTYHHGA